jgi:hypothetical protein
MDVKEDALFKIGILYHFFKVLHRLDLFPVDFQNDVSFLKANIISEAAILYTEDKDATLNPCDSITGSELRG